MKKLLSMLMVLAIGNTAMAQETSPEVNDNVLFKHLDIAFTAGTTGLGFELTAPVTSWANVRMGGTFAPKFDYNMNFGVDYPYNYDNTKTPEENAKLKQGKFDKMADIMENFTGKRPKPSVDMVGEPIMNNFKFLIDVYPFKDKKQWHFTAGFYLGSSTLATATNSTESMTSLMGVSIFNKFYHSSLAMGYEPFIEYQNYSIYNEELANKFRNFGRMSDGTYAEYGLSVPKGEFTHDVIATEDIYWDYTVIDDNFDELHHKGDIRFHKGDVMYKEGETFRITPDEDYMIRATAKVNAFKPFLGAGYSTSISNDGRTQLSVDAGVLFWGGRPQLLTRTPAGITEDGKIAYLHIDMVKDLRNIGGKVGKYTNLFKAAVVYPVVEVRISQRLF